MYLHVELIHYMLLVLLLFIAIYRVSNGFSWGSNGDKSMGPTFFMMIVMVILGGLVHGINGALGATLVKSFVGLIVTGIVEKVEKAQATNIKKQEYEKKRPYVASPEELPKVLEMTGLRRVDPSLVHLCDWQGRAVTDRNMPNGKVRIRRNLQGVSRGLEGPDRLSRGDTRSYFKTLRKTIMKQAI